MDHTAKKGSHLGSALATLGGTLGVLGVIVMSIGLKATITPGTHNVTLIRSVLSVGGLVIFGLSVGLIVAGALLGRRMTGQNNEGPVEHQAQTDPLLPNVSGFPETIATSTYGSKQPVESKTSSSSNP